MNPNTIRSAAAAIALAGSASGLLAQGMFSIQTDDPQGTSSSTAMWSIMTNVNGRMVKIESRNGAITAEVDGKPVPADRVERDGNTVRIKDANGDIIAEQQVPGVDTSVHTYTFTGPGSAGPGGITMHTPRTARATISAGPHDRTKVFATVGDPPKVMIGVQLLDPDSTLRGHLGLKEDEATMVGAIYEGLAAAKAGIEPYDIIVSVDGKSPAPPSAVRKALHDADEGKTFTFEVIHRGQKKSITVTPEKYDRERLDKAKVNAIAAASNTPGAQPFPGMDEEMHKQMAEVMAQQGNPFMQPYMMTIPGQPGGPGQPMVMWNTPGGGTGNMQDFTKHMQELMEHTRQQAEMAQQQAEQMRQQMQRQMGAGGPGAPGQPPQMNDRMKNIEDMLQKLMEKEKARDEKGDGRS